MNKAEKIFENNIGLNQELGYKPIKKEDVIDCIKEALKHGGKRKGAGRKRLYTEETQTISFRVPKSKIDQIKQIVKKHLALLT